MALDGHLECLHGVIGAVVGLGLDDMGADADDCVELRVAGIVSSA